MHVCHLVHHLANGGLEKQIYELVRRNDDLSFSVCYLGEDNSMAEDIEDAGGNVIDLISGPSNPRVLYDREVIRTVVRFLKENEFDVLHVHTPLYVHILGRMCAKLAGQKNLVGTYHNRQRNFHWLMQYAERLTRPLSTVNVGVSKAVQRSFTSRADEYVPGMDVPNRSSYTIYNGIDIEAFNSAVSSATSLRSQFGLDNELVFLNVGRYTPQKAQVDLIRAMSYAEGSLSNAHLFVVGWGQLEEKLKRTVRDHRLSDVVTITGKVPSIEEYYKMADVFVLSSAREGLPIVLLEAMAARLPVVSTDVSGISEVVEDGETGFLVPSQSSRKLAKKMTDLKPETLRKRFGKNGFDRASEKFNVSRTNEGYLGLYRSLIE